MKNILWLRRDLKLQDNASLHRALLEPEPVQPIFIFDTDILARFTNKSDRRISFIANALSLIHKELVAKGGGLLVLHGSPRDIVPKLAAKFGGKVFAGRDYEPSTIKRDEFIANQTKLILSKQHLLLEPQEVLKADSSPYKVFTPYSKAWREALHSSDEYEIKDVGRYAKFDSQLDGFKIIDATDPAKICEQIGYEYFDDKIWHPSKAAETLQNFASKKVGGYATKRDLPAVDGTSNLSPYLRFGLVTIREAYNATIKHEASFKWINELIWREFYAMILFHFPHTVNKEFQEHYQGLEWDTNQVNLEKWKQGKTGYPIVDAGIRQLLETGWMHNRVRMIVASFLTKDLLIDWRLGEEHFAQHLMDYEQASNVGGWQWASSTGTDAAPYFRVFNPLLQSKKFDADGEYIRRYVPELKALHTAEIHEPSPLMRPKDYPAPIVNHASVKPKVMAFFKR